MNMRKYAFSLVSLVFLFSCSDENNKQFNDASVFGEAETQLTEAELKVLLRMRDANNRVSLDEAMEEANWVIDFLNGEGSLKSGSNRKVNSISALVSGNARPVALKSSDADYIELPDTLAYILNFNDSLGFAIISADTRIDGSMLAFAESGSLIDSTDNPGIAIFLEHLEGYMLNSIAEAEQQYDSLIAGILEKLDIDIETDTKATEEEKAAAKEAAKAAAKAAYEALYGKIIYLVQPLVPVQWGQGTPFNNNVGGQCNNDTGNNKYWAGCVATAVAQIMSYWKHPASMNGYSFNWGELNQYTARPKAYPGAGEKDIDSAPANVKSQLANLFLQIGKEVNMNYGCEGSGAHTENAMSLLIKHGFKVMTVAVFGTPLLIDYNSNNAIASISRKEPLIVRGCSHKTVTTTKFLGITVSTSSSYDGCHAWVIDGYMKRRATSNGVNIDYDYIHNNWGWYGDLNGYFRSGVFNSSSGLVFSSGTKSNDDRNFQYRLEMTPYIRR